MAKNFQNSTNRSISTMNRINIWSFSEERLKLLGRREMNQVPQKLLKGAKV